jgi:hypothetical protein
VDKDLKASTLDKGENNSKTMDETICLDVNKGEKRLFEREMEEKEQEIKEISFLERVDKRIRFSGEDSNEQSKIIRPTLTKPTVNNQKILSDDDSKDDDDDEEDEDDNPPKTRRNSMPTIRIVPKRTSKTTAKRLIQLRNDRLSSKPSMSLRKPLTEPIKKKIKITRRRSTSRRRTRTRKQSVATWVKKYNIEECCILLDLYNPIYETGRD